MLSPLEKAGLALMIFVLMIGMGATLDRANFKAALRRPKGFIVGFLSQFGLMPLIAFGLAKAFSLPNEAAIGLILVGCTPGGTTSNLFTYYAKGDVALSVAMTVASTIGAIALMPLLLSIYATPFTTAALKIPYVNIVSTLVLILVPVAIGMAVRSKSVQKARTLEKVGSYVGMAVILFLLVEFILKNSEMVASTSWQIYITSILLGLCGFLFGFGASKAFQLPNALSKTVALETGIQNTPLTFAIIILSFNDATRQAALLHLPIFYALFIVITSTLVTPLFRRLE